MKQISSMDLYFLTRELKIIENSRIESFYYENETFYIKLYLKSKGHKFLTYKLGKSIFIEDKKEETNTPSSFTSYLRKYLKNGFVETIDQIESERILKIKITKKIEEEIKTFYLFLELFQPGNIIITNSNLEIINTLKRKKYKDRKIVVKEKYELPPKKEITPFNINKDNLKKELENCDLSIVKFLAIKMGMGGKFSEEICSRANINKDLDSKNLNKQQIETLITKIKEILDIKISAFIINDFEDFIPFDFISIKKEKKEFSSFNETIKEYFSTFKETKDKREEEFKKELEKLKKILEKQENLKNHILEEYEKLNNTGNKIYENFSTIEELLNSINKAAKEKGWDKVLETIKNNKELSSIIKKLNYKNNEITLDLN